jgi:hypothetical protein
VKHTRNATGLSPLTINEKGTFDSATKNTVRRTINKYSSGVLAEKTSTM